MFSVPFWLECKNNDHTYVCYIAGSNSFRKTRQMSMHEKRLDHTYTVMRLIRQVYLKYSFLISQPEHVVVTCIQKNRLNGSLEHTKVLTDG